MKTVEEMNDEDIKLACYKLLARLYYKLAYATNATEINYKVEEIVKWVLEDSEDESS